MTQPRVADDFAMIRARMEELRREREAADATESEAKLDAPTRSNRNAYWSQPARSFYERLGAVHAETKELEHPGGGSSASWRMVWARPIDLRLRADALSNKTNSRRPT